MTNTNLTKHRIWAGLIGFLALVFATIVIYSSSHPFEVVFRVEMDDNSVKVVQSLNGSINPQSQCLNACQSIEVNYTEINQRECPDFVDFDNFDCFVYTPAMQRQYCENKCSW